MLKQAKKGGVEIWPDNWHAWSVFRGMRTQWRMIPAGMSGTRWQGLDYASLPIVLAEHRRNPHRQPLDVLMPQLRELEYAAQKQLNGDD